MLIGNGKFYGGRFPIFPRADLADGVLEAVMASAGSIRICVHARFMMSGSDSVMQEPGLKSLAIATATPRSIIILAGAVLLFGFVSAWIGSDATLPDE